ncbi:MAG: zinc-binding dehydrogenase [Candidatus Velthaea sp.]
MTLPREARAAVTLGPGAVEVRRFALPELRDDDALLAVEAAGVCGSDYPFFAGMRDGGARIQGHENVGRIAAIGAAAARRWNLAAGDRVVVEEFIPCWQCRMCRTGNYRICDRSDLFLAPKDLLRYGDTPVDVAPALWGGFAEYQYLHPNSLVYRMADHVAADAAPLFIPIANGLRWVREVAQLPVGGTIVIQGPGQHGLGCVIAAKESGAAAIVVVGLARDRVRFAAARALGATHVVVAPEEDVEARVRAITGGELADVVIDLTPGVTAPLSLAMRLVRKLGVVIMAGAKHERMNDLDSMQIYAKELTVRGVRGHDIRSVVPAIALIESGRYDFTPLLTHRYGLNDVARALATIGGRADADAIHLNVVPGGAG